MTTSLASKLAAELFGTFWLVFGAAAAQFSRPNR